MLATDPESDSGNISVGVGQLRAEDTMAIEILYLVIKGKAMLLVIIG